MKKLAVLVSQFPEMHETFVARELAELDSQGIDLCIYSYKPADPNVTQSEALRMKKRTRYGRLLSPAAAGALIHHLAHRPVHLLRAFAALARLPFTDRAALVKAWGLVPLSLVFARDMARQGVVHVHAHWATVPCTQAAFISRLLGIDYSFTAHAFDIFLTDGALGRKLSDASFAVTCTQYNVGFLREALRRVDPVADPCKAVCNYHGVSTTNPLLQPRRNGGPKRGSPALILTIGRLVEQKGFGDLIRAVRLLRDEGRDVRLEIIGKGPLQDELRELSRQLSLQDQVCFGGGMPLREVLDRVATADVFALPSVIGSDGDRDGIPNVLIEALALEVPAVSTRVSGIPELVRHEETGLLVEPHDPHGLAEAIARILDDPELGCRLGRGGRRRVQSVWDVTTNVHQLVDIFRERVPALAREGK
ncbi:MAG: glycosyltransferase family 4 protein [Candidatus Krumholzibacteriia bacterium]